MSAPNLTEIEYLISRLEGMESSEDRYMLLSALYTCRNVMMGQCSEPQNETSSFRESRAYAEASAPEWETLDRYGDSEFLQAVEGQDPAAAWAIMDELMDTLRAVNRRAYESVIRKLSAL